MSPFRKPTPPPSVPSAPRHPAAPTSSGGSFNLMYALIAASIVLLVGIGWYGLAPSHKSAAPAPEPSARSVPGSKPGTWELWSESKMWKPGAPTNEPSSSVEMPLELNLDRATCELVKQGKVRGAQQEAANADSVTAHDYGAIYYYMDKNGNATHFLKSFSCVPAGQTR